MLGKVLIFVTGPPRTGKTQVGERLGGKFGDEKAIFRNDYPFLKLWAKEVNEQRPDWVELFDEGRNFNIHALGYVPMSEWVAKQMAAQVAEDFETKEVVIVEMARGVGEPMAKYGEHAIGPMVRELKQRGIDCRVANFEMRAEKEVIVQRLEADFKADPESTPPWVIDKYMDKDGRPLLESVKELGGDYCGLVEVNQVLENGLNGNLDELAQQAYDMIRERFFPGLEGQHGRGVEQ